MPNERRRDILNILKTSGSPVNGSELGERFKVSRQVIVQDIALLRAEGEDIIATPRGYMVVGESSKILKKIVSCHRKTSELEEELRIIIDRGGRLVDVIVEHPVYGEITGNLDLRTRKDIDSFLEKLKESEGEPLSLLTAGIHIHTIEVESEEDFLSIEKELFEKGYLKK